MAGLGHSKRPPPGRSVEEVLLMRRLAEKGGGVSLPVIKTSQSSSSLPVLGPREASVPQTAQSTKTVRISTAKERTYSETDVHRMMEEVMQFTRALQNRVAHLEGELLATQRNQGTGAFHSTLPSEGGFPGPDTRDLNVRVLPTTAPMNLPASRSNAAMSKAVTIAHDAILNIDSKVLNLKDIFRRKDPIEERYEAAVRIQALIRRFLIQCRRRAHDQAQKDWRWQRCRPVVWLLDILLSNQSKLDTGFHLLRMNRTMRTLLVFFGKWGFICRQNAPLRQAMREGAARRIEEKRIELLRKVFRGLHEVSIGGLSTKNAILERRKLIDRIRFDLSSDLQALGLVGVVPEDEVFKVLHRKVVEQFHSRQRVITKRFKFGAFAQLVSMAKRNEVQAARHRFRTLVGKCFYAWSDFVYLRSRGLDRKRWPGPRKYEVRYNQKRVDHFSRVRCERFVFSAWKDYFAIQLQVKRRYQRKKAEFISAVFRGWRGITNAQRVLRRKTYDNWKGYATLITQQPFQAWADYVRGLKNQYQEHLRIAKAYRRWKQRQKLFVIVKTWRHQALFGRVDGLYTRQMLLKSLGEQKIFASSIEKCMADQLLELEECKKVVVQEIDKRKAYEADITRLNAEVNKTRMTIHHYEQELKRMHSTLQSLATINPKHVDHIGNMQGEFKFKERSIALGGGSSQKSASLLDAAGGTGGGMPGAPPPAPALETIAEAPKAGLGTGAAATKAADDVPLEVVAPPKLKSSNSAATVSTLGDKEAGEADDDHSVLPKTSEPDATASSGQPPAPSTGLANTTPAAPAGSAGPTVSAEDQAMLERAHWLLQRYREAMPKGPPKSEHLVLNSAPPALALITGSLLGNPAVAVAEAGGLLEDPAGQDSQSVASQSVTSQPKTPQQLAASQPVVRMSLFKPSSGSIFMRSVDSAEPAGATRSPSALVPDAIAAGMPASPTRRLSVVRRPSMSLRASAGGMAGGSISSNALAMAMASAVNAVNAVSATTPSAMAGGDFYNDEELEDLVIVWAKMLVTFFDFLETGDITNLPSEDQRQWARHLLRKARNEGTAAEPSPLGAEATVPAPAVTGEALTTVDKQMAGEANWRQALLTLRTMFPGAGNFSGLGVALTPQEDISFSQRVLEMHKELTHIEAQAAAKHQKRFIDAHLAHAPPTLAPPDPLEMSVYAGNLRRLAELEQQQQEAQRELLTVDATMRRTLPQLQDDPAADLASLSSLDEASLEI